MNEALSASYYIYIWWYGELPCSGVTRTIELLCSGVTRAIELPCSGVTRTIELRVVESQEP